MPNDSTNTTPSASLETTLILDVAQLYQTDVKSPEFIEFIVRMVLAINRMLISINNRDVGIYATEEFVNGQTFFPNPNTVQQIGADPNHFRQAIRMTIDFGTLPNTGTTSVAHNIPVGTGTTWTRIYATATDPIGLTGLPIPYSSSTAANIIELNVDSVNVNITTGSDRTNYTSVIVVLEYLQD